MSKKGIEFTIEIEEIKDYEEFMNNEELLNELQKLVDDVHYGCQIGFTDDDILRCTGKIINETKKECEAEYTIFKGKYKKILEKYYSKVNPIDRMKMYFTTVY